MIARTLKARRLELGLTQEEAARRARLSARTVMRIENDQSSPTESLIRLCRALDIDYHALAEAVLNPATHETVIIDPQRGVTLEVAPNTIKPGPTANGGIPVIYPGNRSITQELGVLLAGLRSHVPGGIDFIAIPDVDAYRTYGCPHTARIRASMTRAMVADYRTQTEHVLSPWGLLLGIGLVVLSLIGLATQTLGPVCLAILMANALLWVIPLDALHARFGSSRAIRNERTNFATICEELERTAYAFKGTVVYKLVRTHRGVTITAHSLHKKRRMGPTSCGPAWTYELHAQDAFIRALPNHPWLVNRMRFLWPPAPVTEIPQESLTGLSTAVN